MFDLRLRACGESSEECGVLDGCTLWLTEKKWT
jgi:hypothetical protein